MYVDPADLVAATVDKAKADDIQTWSVSEVDKKGKKKKGTLGVGNGALFFASESDKVQGCLSRVLIYHRYFVTDSGAEMADFRY